MSDYRVESFPLSDDLLRAMDLAEEQADLEIAKLPLTGFELDVLERIDRAADLSIARSLMFGTHRP